MFGRFALLCLGMLLAFRARSALALELHTFADERCALHSGVLIGVDDEAALLIGLDGQGVRVPRDRIVAVVVHKTLENPLPAITLSDAVQARMRSLWVGEDREATFTGWAVSFFDDLVIFLDTDGKTHALEREDIYKIRLPSGRLPGEIRPSAAAPARLDFPPELLPCTAQAPAGDLRPSRVLADRIKIGDYLGRLRERYFEIASFEERTRVYARPFLFDPTMRLGLVYFSHVANYVPLYFQWSNGKPYRFQSLTAIGRIQTPWVPLVEPSLSVRSDVKSHFFNAVFIGHIPSLAAGSSAFFIGRELYGLGRQPGVRELFNYVAILGADWDRFSAGIGPYYRALELTSDASRGPRELVADRASLALRLMYTGPWLRARVMSFHTRQGNPEGRGLRTGPGAAEEPGAPGSSAIDYRIEMDTVRAGVDAELWGEIEVSVDHVLSLGRYREHMSTEPAPWRARFRHSTTALAVRQAFGRYVAVTGYGNLKLLHHRFPNVANTSRTELQYGGALEFLF